MFKRVSTMMVAAGLAVSSILTPVAASPAEAAGLPDLQIIRKGDTFASTGQT